MEVFQYLIKFSYNGEGLPRVEKKYDEKNKEKNSFILFKREDIKPALPWGLDTIYRYVWEEQDYLYIVEIYISKYKYMKYFKFETNK